MLPYPRIPVPLKHSDIAAVAGYCLRFGVLPIRFVDGAETSCREETSAWMGLADGYAHAQWNWV